MPHSVRLQSGPFHGGDDKGGGIASHGTWLCHDNPYHDIVADTCVLDPGLRKPDVHYRTMPVGQARSRMAILSVAKDGAISRQDVARVDQLREHFRDLDAGGLPRASRIYILEGLQPGFVGQLGARFKLDPGMFKRQERSSVFQTDHSRPNDNRLLPSSRSKHYMLLRYFEVLNFGMPLPSMTVACADTGRHVGANKFLDGLPAGVAPDDLDEGRQPDAAVRRKVSFWSRDDADGGWNAVILCDPPVRILRDGEGEGESQWIQVSPTPFQDGYVDFVPFDERIGGKSAGPPRTCFLEDFAYYFTTYADRLQHTTPTSPGPGPGPGREPAAPAASLFVKKLVAAHLLEFSTFVQAISYDRSWQMSKLKPGFTDADMVASNDQWGAAQGLSLRCAQYVEEMASNLVELRIHPDAASSHDAVTASWPADVAWAHYQLDYRYIQARLAEAQARLDALTGSLGDLAGMVATRIAREDGRRAQMLTAVGLVFVPLAYATGLFSMSDEYRPGKGFFWVYFAVALPMLLLMVGAMFVFNRHFRLQTMAFFRDVTRWRNWVWGSGSGMAGRKRGRTSGGGGKGEGGV